ncbi:MAG: efflux RND transporter permease subunit [Deltaproteobacteria bacterium]|nr:efflux RND transporter permease subunit [Deltaproteobacteria bacterium]
MSLGGIVSANRTAILGLSILLAIAGLWSAWTMPVSIFPEVAFHRIDIIARAGDLPVEQSVTALTRPLENALSGVLGVETIRSMTTRGGAQLDLVFSWNQDMLRALQLVQAAMEETRANLPAGVELEARLLDTSAFPVVGIAVSSNSAGLAQISEFATYEAAPRLRTIPGVYRVELSGAKQREYSLTLDPDALVRHHLDLDSVAQAVRQANIVAGSGRVGDGHLLTLTVVRGEALEPAKLLDVVVAQEGATPLRLGDVAKVESSLREDYTRAAADGKTAVLIGVSRQPTGNVINVSSGVRAIIEQLAREHPEYEIAVFYDQADLVHEAIASVRDSILVGLLLAVGTIFFFIAEWRTTVVAAAVIPTTVLISCIVLHALGMSFNLMTLGGVAAGIGLILDDAIVVIENFHRHRGLGEPVLTALPASMLEITHALLGSTLTPVAVLLPLALLSGVPGAFFQPLAVTMSVALLVSLLLALSFTPALATLMESGDAGRAGRGPGDRSAAWLSGFYARGMGWTLRRPWLTLGACLAVAGCSFVAYGRIETGFIPEMDEGAFVLDYWSPPGTSLEETTRMLATVDSVLQATPEVAAFSRRTGSELGFFLTEANRGDYAIRLHGERQRDIETIMDTIRDQIHARLPGMRIEFVQIMQDMIGDLSGNPNPVEVKFFGANQQSLEATARAALSLVAEVPGIVDEFDGLTEIGPTYEVKVDERASHLVGLNAEVVQRWLETATTGAVVGQVLDGDRAIPLRLRYPDELRGRLDRVADLTLVDGHGKPATLRSLAHLSAGPVAVQRTRENLRQMVRLTARLSHREIGSALQDIQGLLRQRLVVPPGVSIEYGGLYASQQQAFSELLLVFGGSIACVLALLLIEFGSLASALAIVIGSSLALSGSLLSLWVTGTSLNVSSIVGMIMVVGIVAKNGILLLDFARREFTQCKDRRAALIRAGTVRLRPILMTSLAAIAGLAPLAAGIGAGSQMQQPLAIAILGGVSLSMIFSLLAIPTLEYLLTRRK